LLPLGETDTVRLDEMSFWRDSLDEPADFTSFSGHMVMSNRDHPGVQLTAKLHFEFRQVGPILSMLGYFTFTDTPLDYSALNAAIDQRVAAALA
jgi:hypothetical protein